MVVFLLVSVRWQPVQDSPVGKKGDDNGFPSLSKGIVGTAGQDAGVPAEPSVGQPPYSLPLMLTQTDTTWHWHLLCAVCLPLSEAAVIFSMKSELI